MSKKRKLHQLKGSIHFGWPGKSKSKVYKNQPFYGLEIKEENLLETKKTTIYVFPNLVSQEIWKTLAQEDYESKKYLFYCERRVRGWRLREWEEINNHEN